MTSIEFLQTIPPNITSYFFDYVSNRDIDTMLAIKNKPNEYYNVPNVMLIEKVSKHPAAQQIVMTDMLDEVLFVKEFIRNLRLTNWLTVETKQSLAKDSIFLLLLMLNCTSEAQFESYANLIILPLREAQRAGIMNGGTSYTDYSDNSMEFLKLYYNGLSNLLDHEKAANGFNRCITEIVLFLDKLGTMIKVYDQAFFRIGLKLLSPPLYLPAKMKKRLFLLLIIPEISFDVYNSLPRALRLTTSDLTYLRLFSSRRLNPAQYNTLIKELPKLSGAKGLGFLKEFNNVLWMGHTVGPFSKQLKKNLVPGQKVKEIKNLHKKELLVQLITFLLPNYHIFWKKNNWNNNLEVQKRIFYIKNTIQWRPNVAQLTKYVLCNN